MHSAPSVTYPVGRSRALDRLLTAIWVLGAGCTGTAAFGLAIQGADGWRVSTLCATVLLSGLLSWRFRQRTVEGALTFDGAHWSLSGAAAGDARIGLDLQRLMLLRIVGPDRRSGHWLWVDRNADRARWLDLRRALYADGPRAEVGHPSGDAAPRRGRRSALA